MLVLIVFMYLTSWGSHLQKAWVGSLFKRNLLLLLCSSSAPIGSPANNTEKLSVSCRVTVVKIALANEFVLALKHTAPLSTWRWLWGGVSSQSPAHRPVRITGIIQTWASEGVDEAVMRLRPLYGASCWVHDMIRLPRQHSNGGSCLGLMSHKMRSLTQTPHRSSSCSLTGLTGLTGRLPVVRGAPGDHRYPPPVFTLCVECVRGFQQLSVSLVTRQMFAGIRICGL